MPAFTYVASVIVANVIGIAGAAVLGSAGIAFVTGAIATGLAYVTSRIINGNPNKGGNSAMGSQGGRIQVPPASNNKIPVVYGSAYMNGMITDARLLSLGGTKNDTMYYCIVLSETCNDAAATYAINNIYWNDLRLTTVDSTTNSHKIKDGRKNVDDPDTSVEDFIDTNFVQEGSSLVEVRVYAGSTAAAKQIWPAQSTGNTTPAYTFWANNNGDWDSTYQMKGLVFAIVKVTWNSDKGFTGLPNMTFNVSNSINSPADVWYDYMTADRYGAGISDTAMDTGANTTWKNFCNETITYTPVGGGSTTQSRYTINGVIDTNRPVKDNIDTILQNGGAWMSYNVATGLWSPVIKKAVSAGDLTDVTKQFTASRTGSTLTVTNFPGGRIEAGQLLYNVSGTLIGTISAQLTPTTGETAGQLGRYTTSTSGSIGSTTFYTLPASSLQFSDDNIISGISISSTRLDDLYNQVEAEFYNSLNKDQRAYARVDIPDGERNPNEPDNQLRMSLDLCNNSVQAELLGQMEMRQSRDDLVVDFTTNFYGIQAQAGDVIAITSELYDWAPKYFRVMRIKEQETEDGGLIAQIQALEYNPDVYTVEEITQFTTSANIGIGRLVSSPGLPKPNAPTITNARPDDSIPNFTYNVLIPDTGGPFDEIEIYFTEGWDDQSVTMSVVPGTGSNGVPVGKGLMTVTSLQYNSLNVGDYFTAPAITIESQLTQTTISTKTYSSGGAIGAYTVVLNNITDIIPGQMPTGTGIPSGAMVVSASGTTVTLDKAFTVQAAGSYLFTTAGGTGTYQVDTSTTLTSAARTLWDQPIDADFKYLKKITPTGNASAFTSNTTISAVVTELAANTQTYRRYFLKSRMGWKKNFGAFSDNGTVDLTANVNWIPNPTAAGRLSDLTDVNVATRAEGDVLYYDATTSKWLNTPILSINDGAIGISVNSTNNNRFNTETNFTNLSTAPLILRHTTSATPAAGFGTALAFETETPGSGNKTGAYIDAVMTNATAGSEDFRFRIGLMRNGVQPSDTVGTELILTSTGDLEIAGDLTVTGNDIKSSSGSTAITLSGTNVQIIGDTRAGDNVILNYDQANIDAYLTAYKSTAFGSLYWNGSIWTTTHPLTVTGDITTSGDIRINGNDIKSSTGATAITLSGTNVQIIGDTRAGDNVVLNFDQSNNDAYLTAYKSTNFGSLYWDGTKWNTTHALAITGALTTTTTALIGSNANFTDFPNAQMVVSLNNTGDAHVYNAGIVGEATATSTDANRWGIGVYGVGFTNGAVRSAGVKGDGSVTSSTDSGSAIGVRGYATDTHASGLNIGLYGEASSGLANYALYMNGGDILSTAAQTWTLLDNSSTALSFNAAGKSGILKIISTDSGEGVSVNGNLLLNGSTSGTVGFKAAAAAGSTTYTLPSADGTSGQFLKTDGSATLSWATASGGSSALKVGIPTSAGGNFDYAIPGYVPTGANAASWSTLASNVIYQPIYVQEAISVSSVGFHVAAAAGVSSCNVMIYIDNVSLNATGWQSTGHLSGGYFGEITGITTSGFKSITPASPITLNAGYYLVALQLSAYTASTFSISANLGRQSQATAYTINKTAINMTVADAWLRTGVSYSSGTPAAVADWTPTSVGTAGHRNPIVMKWTVV